MGVINHHPPQCTASNTSADKRVEEPLTQKCCLCKIKCIPLESHLKRLEKQGDGNMKFSKRKCKVLYLGSSISLGMTTGKQLCREGTASTEQSDHEPAMQPCKEKRPMTSWAALERALPAQRSRWSFPLLNYRNDCLGFFLSWFQLQ